LILSYRQTDIFILRRKNLSNRLVSINLLRYRNVRAKKKSRIPKEFCGATDSKRPTDRPTHRMTDWMVTIFSGVLQRSRSRDLQPDGASQSTSRGRISGTTDDRMSTKVGRRWGESWLSIWLGNLFSSISYQFRVACHNCQSVASIKHPHLSLSFSLSLPPSSPFSIPISFFSSFCFYLRRDLSLSIAPIRRNITDSNLRRFTHALIRGWWEEADGRRRGACTWCAKIYEGYINVWRCILYTYVTRARGVYVCVCGRGFPNRGWIGCIAGYVTRSTLDGSARSG